MDIEQEDIVADHQKAHRVSVYKQAEKKSNRHGAVDPNTQGTVLIPPENSEGRTRTGFPGCARSGAKSSVLRDKTTGIEV
jgi:hypothetical protein